MPSFVCGDREYLIKFDGLLLLDLREAHGIDLADVSGETYARLQLDQALLTRAVAFLCGEQLKAAGLTERQFSAGLTGEAAEKALGAVWGAARSFFRPSLLSALESAYSRRIAMEQIKPLLTLLSDQSLPAGIRETMAGQIATALSASEAKHSASGPVVSPPSSASASPEPVESAPAA